MSTTKMTCVYCREEKEVFNKEHIVPVCFGATAQYLEDLVCSDCNKRFNEEFEGRFLKGPGIESFFRAVKGLKGRREYPIFGDGSYSNRIYHTFNDDFPPIEVLIKHKNISAPLQMIIMTEKYNLFHILYEEDKYDGDIRLLFDNLFSKLKTSEKPVASYMWLNATDVTVSNYRKIRKEFYCWLGRKGLQGDFMCLDFKGTTVKLYWETVERQRMFSKMCLNFMFWLYPERDICLLSNFDILRNFILTGKGNGKSLVHQWTAADHPFMLFMKSNDYHDLYLGLFEFKGEIYGVVYFPKVGPFIVNIGLSANIPERPLRKSTKKYEGTFRQFVGIKNGEESFWSLDPNIAAKISSGFTGHQQFSNIASD
jgi:hypothetical protein